jgi:DNA-binding transcriptional LysR family regulator
MTAMLTTPYRAKHPDVRFTIVSRTSIQVLSMLENLEVDAGLTYLDNEPLGRVNTVALYHEEYRLLTSRSAELGDRDQVTWAEVGASRCACSRPTCRTGASSTACCARPA